jgi:hypothetical protein
MMEDDQQRWRIVLVEDTADAAQAYSGTTEQRSQNLWINASIERA